ncbi:MAG: hypothetical protein AAGJ19_07475 [Myxococcota bacterium]
MAAFIDNVSSFPTVVFTTLLVFALLYWGLVIAGAADLDSFDFDLDVEADGGTGIALLSWLGMRRVPLSVTLSVAVLVAWMACYLYVDWFEGWVGGVAGELVIGLAALITALPATALAAVPLEPFFKTVLAEKNASLVGKMCRVRSGQVDQESGVGVVIDGTDGDVVQIRSRRGALSRGDDALIISYDPEANAFQVEAKHALETSST